MSKKHLRSRIDHLFSELAGSGSPPTEPGSAGEGTPPGPNTGAPVGIEKDNRSTPAVSIDGWSWEINEQLRYTSCGAEVSDALGRNPLSFVGQSFLTQALSSGSRAGLEAALACDFFPFECAVLFENSQGKLVPARIHILSRLEVDGQIRGWRGIAQPLPGNGSALLPAPEKIRLRKTNGARPSPAVQKIPTGPLPDMKPSHPPTEVGVAVEMGDIHPSTSIWTETGQHSLTCSEMVHANAAGGKPAAIALPLKTQGTGGLLLEIVDDAGEREWSEDDRSLVQEIATQLTLALDNAHLYISVQQELSERIRAEQATLRRNKELATLNQIGQQLSRLATRAEIFEVLSSMIGEVLDAANLYICSYSASSGTLSFPVYHKNGRSIHIDDRPFRRGIPEYVIRNGSPLLIPCGVQQALADAGIDPPEPCPASLLAIPMIAGERAVGAIVVQDFHQENTFDSLHAELLSTTAAQASTALENADLFQQMQNALEVIENRERYQANVARSVAILTEFGTKSMPDVFKVLGQAARCSRVFFARLQEDERGLYWSAAAEWVDPAIAYLFDRSRVLHIPVTSYRYWAQALREKGWVVTQSEEDTAEADFLNNQHIRTSLLLAVPGAASTPSFVMFDQLGAPRTWLNEEISALRVAADAISNTIIREGLLEQLQITLDETEGLYKASNRLALANDMQEMVSAVLSGVRSNDINRAVLLLFEYDTYGKIVQIVVSANWYNGRGTPPPPVGTEYLRAKYERFFQTPTPIFYNDILESQAEKNLQDTLLHQNIRALGILPLWSGRRQIGVLLLQSETRHNFSGRETRTYPPLVDQMAISVENQRLFDQTQIALSETELLYNISSRIAQASSPRDILALVVDLFLPKGADRASLIFINSDANGELLDLEMVGGQDVRGEYQPIGVNLPVSDLSFIRSLTDEPLIVSDVHQYPFDTASQRTLEQFHAGAICMVPLRTGGRLIGLLNASSRYPTEFTQEDTRLMRIAGSGIAVALEKQRLLRQAQRRALELQTASEIARDTASTLSLDLLLNRIVNMLCERFDFYHASIFLLDDNRAYAVIRESTGEAGQEMKRRGHRLAVGSRSVVGAVTATGEPYILSDVHHNPMHSNPLLPDTHSEMGVPLKLGPTVIGALELQSRNANAFHQDDVTVLQILADQIAIAIENARAYELSQKAIADMREIDRVKSQFLANMSHELRTPLNSIIGFSRVIIKGIDGPINDTQKQDLSAIYNSGQHLLSLINDILDLSKIEAGKMELSFADTSLPDLINSAMSTAIGLVKDKPIRLNTIIPENLPLVRADSTRIRQVLINFLSNAAKFTDEGFITVEVTQISNAKGMPELMVTVTDTGPGIAPEDQSKLFLPFSQVDDSPTRKTGGTGLGLSICRSLIDMHDGTIGLLNSRVGQGSCFYFTLPAVVIEPLKKSITAELTSNIILSIDDDPKVINLYERYLKPFGYQVIAETHPGQAVARVKEVRPFAITLDIAMPERDGWHVLRDIKNDPETCDVPIIICSILESQEIGFSMGAADYLVKPFLQEDMLNAIQRLDRDGKIHEVVVVDDDPSDLRLVQKLLEENPKYHITMAQGGKQGWEIIQANRPDVVILDLFMPDLNGFTILENLRANPILRRIPVIVLTGADLTPEQHQQLTEFGQGVLAKGYLGEKELLLLLEEALRKFHPTQTNE